MTAILAKISRHARELTIVVGVILLAVGIVDVSFAAKTVNLRGSPVWPVVALGAAVAMFAWLVPIKTLVPPASQSPASTDRSSSGTEATKAQLDPLSKQGANADDLTLAGGNLDGRLATIYLLRHFEEDYAWPSRYASALYWWFKNEEKQPIDYEEFKSQEDAWKELARAKAEALVHYKFAEPIGSETKISEKGRAVLHDDAFRGKNARAFIPELIMHSTDLRRLQSRPASDGARA